jgi:hypothetical protein
MDLMLGWRAGLKNFPAGCSSYTGAALGLPRRIANAVIASSMPSGPREKEQQA